MNAPAPEQKKTEPKFHAASGVFVSGSGGSLEVTGTMEVMLAGLLGGMAGLVAGMLAGVLTRFSTINRLKGMIGGMHWGAYGAGAGALGLAVFEFFN